MEAAAPFAIKSFGIAPDPTSQDYLSRRVLGKLGKFAKHIKGLEIRLRPLGWIGGQAQVSCSLSVNLDDGGHLDIERSALGPRAAFDHAMGVAERMLRQTLQRLRHQRVPDFA